MIVGEGIPNSNAALGYLLFQERKRSKSGKLVGGIIEGKEEGRGERKKRGSPKGGEGVQLLFKQFEL